MVSNHYDSAANQYYFPTYFFALNPGVTNPGVGNPPVACYYISNQLVSSTDYIQVSAINGWTPSGSVSANYNIEFGPTTSGTITPTMKQLHNWSQIKMLTYGTIDCPGKWLVRVVKFKNDEYNPAFIYQNMLAQRTNERKIVQFYQALNQWAMRSPVDLPKANEKYGQIMSVVKSWGWISNATQTNEGSNTVGHMKDFKIFQKMDQLCDHNWNTGESRIAEADLGITAKYPTETPPVIQPFPNYRNMYYLQVTCQTKYTSAASPPVLDPLHDRPSFDISIRHRVQTAI